MTAIARMSRFDSERAPRQPQQEQPMPVIKVYGISPMDSTAPKIVSVRRSKADDERVVLTVGTMEFVLSCPEATELALSLSAAADDAMLAAAAAQQKASD